MDLFSVKMFLIVNTTDTTAFLLLSLCSFQMSLEMWASMCPTNSLVCCGVGLNGSFTLVLKAKKQNQNENVGSQLACG